jgi:hypothetical protein
VQTPKEVWLAQFQNQPDVKILNDTLEEEASPVDFLKAIPEKKIVIVVPNEWSWPEALKPFQNPKHKHHFDADLLAQDLEAAGLTYILRLLEFSSWSFISAECVRN